MTDADHAATLRLAVLGDSIAWGQGASREQDRLAPRLAAGLSQHGFEAVIRVLARPGARSTDLALQVEHAEQWRPDVVVMVIGANDLTHLEPPGPALAALSDAVRTLRGRGAEVVVAPAPDLSAVPHVPTFLRDVVRAASVDLRGRQVAVVVAEGGFVADEEQHASAAFNADPTLFSADRFHPSSRGYAVIADSMMPTVLLAVRSALGRPLRGSS